MLPAPSDKLLHLQLLLIREVVPVHHGDGQEDHSVCQQFSPEEFPEWTAPSSKNWLILPCIFIQTDPHNLLWSVYKCDKCFTVIVAWGYSPSNSVIYYTPERADLPQVESKKTIINKIIENHVNDKISLKFTSKGTKTQRQTCTKLCFLPFRKTYPPVQPFSHCFFSPLIF